MIALLHRLAHAAHCLVGDHAWLAEVPIAADGTRSPTLHQQCLYCRRTSPGLTQDAPHYAYSAGMERRDARLVLHNSRLKRCACVACEQRRRDRRQKRPVTLRRTA
jgi:hypothetical protein